MTKPTLTEERLAAIKQRCDKADLGPWCWDYIGEKMNGWVVGTGLDVNDNDVEGKCPPETMTDDTFLESCSWQPVKAIGEHEAATANYNTADFIAWSRSDIPLLLDEVNRLRALLALVPK